MFAISQVSQFTINQEAFLPYKTDRKFEYHVKLFSEKEEMFNFHQKN